jgi:rubredoxin
VTVYRCAVCDSEYDEEQEGVKWEDLPDDWVCPVCGAGKVVFSSIDA